ncbi:MAG: nucleotidyltransferase [Anaerolineae bacterium]|nr:MAG: nucleotidyltransferase [Anaerolineae bacterium]
MTDTTRAPLTLDALRARRDEILRLAEQYGAFNVRVFGSVARGEEKSGSDVDLLVSMRPGASMFDLVGLWLDLQDLLGCEVSLVTDDPQPRNERFLRRILKDAISL